MTNYLLVCLENTPLGVLKVIKDRKKLLRNIEAISYEDTLSEVAYIEIDMDNIEAKQEIKVWYDDATYSKYTLNPINVY